MTPTIGRIILVKTAGATPNHPMQTCPAIVCEVHSDTCVSCQVFNREGGKFASSILQSEGLASENQCWDWMPFQKMVAAERESEGKPTMAGGSQ